MRFVFGIVALCHLDFDDCATVHENIGIVMNLECGPNNSRSRIYMGQPQPWYPCFIRVHPWLKLICSPCAIICTAITETAVRKIALSNLTGATGRSLAPP